MNAKAVLLYDGACCFCERQARRLAALDLTGRLDLRDLRGGDLPAGLTVERCEARLHLVEAERISEGYDALRRLSVLLPALWWAAPLLAIPGLRRPLEYGLDLMRRWRFALLAI